MVFISHFLFLFSITHANECRIESNKPTAVLENLTHAVHLGASTTFECIEQEIVDYILDPYRAQSFAVQICEKEATCLSFLKNEASRISKKPVTDFSNMQGPVLWSEILKYSAFHRIRAPELSDFPLKDDPDTLFEKIKSEQMKERNLSSHQALSISCSVLAAVVGPGKLKALKVLQFVNKTSKVERAHNLEKLISKNRLPAQVSEKFLEWEKLVNEKGLLEIKKIPGFHDEPVRKYPGQHSVRLNQRFRLFYEVREENGVLNVRALDITDHTY